MTGIKVSRKTYPAPKWFVDLKEELHQNFDTTLGEYGRSASWWEKAKLGARQEFIGGLAKGDKERVDNSFNLAVSGNEYAFARWIWENPGKAGEMMQYDFERKSIVVEIGLMEKVGEVLATLAQKAGLNG